MRKSNLSSFVIIAISALFVSNLPGHGQPPSQNNKDPKPKQPPYDEFKAILSLIEEAYKAPREVDKDVLDELRKQYKKVSPDRETKIIREIRRLYVTTPESEATILREIRRAYEQPTLDQEEKVFEEIHRGGRLPFGAVSKQAEIEYTARLFSKLDRDRNGLLQDDEIPEALRAEFGRWDRNLDGAINLDEYGPYFRAMLKSISAKVASGEIFLKAAQLPNPSDGTPTPAQIEEPEFRPKVARFGKLPEGLPKWFTEYDRDADGQIGLDEWVKAGKPIAEFLAMDRNGDGLLEAAEVLHYLAKKARANGEEPSAARSNKPSK